MASQAADLARCLARDAEAVCRRYLSNGRRRGRYWVVGDVANTPGRSLFVRLTGPDSGKGAAGKWTDAATGEHGDLLDLIGLNLGLEHLRDALDEARSFLSLPRPQHPPDRYERQSLTPMGSPEFWPALIAAVTDLAGNITGVHRTWLDPSRHDKAPVNTPRRAMGHLLGNGVRFGAPSHDGRRGHRDHAVGPKRSAGSSHGRRTFGQSPRSPFVRDNAATPLRRA